MYNIHPLQAARQHQGWLSKRSEGFHTGYVLGERGGGGGGGTFGGSKQMRDSVKPNGFWRLADYSAALVSGMVHASWNCKLEQVSHQV